MERVFRLFVLSAAALLAALPSVAQEPAPVRPFQFALQNGLQVVVASDRRAPVVTQMLWFKTGAADDPPGLSGMAHFFEHMLFRGTRAVPGEGYAQTIARNGGESNAFTTHDATVTYERIAKDRLRLAMHLEADRMQNLELSEEAVAGEREVVLAERRMRVDNDPEAAVMEQALAALHLSHPYGRPVIGWADEIRRIGRGEAERYYRRHFAPNNAILILAGDIQPDEARDLAEAEYGQLPARDLLARADFAQPPRLGETRLTVESRAAKAPYFLRLYRAQSYAEAAPGRAEALTLLAHMLGGDSASVLYRKLVVERKLATDIAVAYDGYVRDAGTFSIVARPRPGVGLDTLERAIDEILLRYTRHPPTKTELARTKKQLIAGAIFRRDSPYQTAMAYGRAMVVGLTVQDVLQGPDRLRAVSLEAVRKAASAGFDRRQSVTAHMVPVR